VASAATNIANVSTTSYKRSDITASTLATRQSTTAYSAGGVLSAPRQLADVQGLLAASPSSTDMAVSGAGYFTVSRGPAAGGEAFYTRDGSFAPDAQGNLVNRSGAYLLARPATGGQDLAPVNLQRIGGTAQATTQISVGANLPANAQVGDVFMISAQVTDSLGNTQSLPLTFEAQAGGAFRLTIPGAQQSSTSGAAYDSQVTFDGNGAVSSSAPPTIAIASTNGAADLAISLDISGLSRFGGDFSQGFVQADGARFGEVSGVTVSAQGTLSATFNNGETRTIANIDLATFTSPQGLEAVGGNVYRATDASGNPTYGAAGAGQIQGGALELSTTDLGTEFVNMIVAKSSYSAGLKVLTAGQEMSQSLLNVKA